jgi:iron complex transport system ATP-binding protein
MALISLRDAVLHRGGKDILGPINWLVEAGQRWVLLGPNGAGKTSLLSLISAQTHPTRGEVEVLDNVLGKVDVFDLRPRIGLMSPSVGVHLPVDEKVMDIVLTASYGIVGRWRENYELWDESRARALLTILGVREMSERLIGTLSEGERKRVLIARAMMSDPELLLLDEPASGLDLGGREDLLKRLEDLANDPQAPITIIVTHHIEEIPAGTTHALLLKDGKALASGPVTEVVTSEHLTDAYNLPIVVTHDSGRFFACAGK